MKLPVTRKTVLSALLLALVAGFTACQKSYIYHNTFNDESSGTAPGLNAPGPPAGDQTHVSSQSQLLIWVTDAQTAQPIDGKSLILKPPQPGLASPVIRFISAEVSNPTLARKIWWSGRKTAPEPFYCSFAAAVMQPSESLPAIGAVATLIFKDNSVFVSDAGGAVQPVGSIAVGGIHDILISFYPKTGKWSLRVYQPSESVLSHNGAGNAAAVNLAKTSNRFMLECKFLNPGNPNPSAFYVMDDVRIEED